MIVITGAAGFIGSALVTQLNAAGRTDIYLIDDFSTPMRLRNLAWKHYEKAIDKSESYVWLEKNKANIEVVFHLGAKSGYFHDDWKNVHKQYQIDSQKWWKLCAELGIPFIYTTTGATYGNGELGFSDEKAATLALQPEHPYAQMKHEFDVWAFNQTENIPPLWVGLKLFNVYGPNEYHKHKNASMIYKAYNEILSYGSLHLFKSYKSDCENGGQIRDFIYVKDVVKILIHLWTNAKECGIYNAGTGEGRSFLELANIVFKILGMQPSIVFEDIPESIRAAFPYYAVADITKLRSSGYDEDLWSLPNGAEDYIKKFLMRGDFY